MDAQKGLKSGVDNLKSKMDQNVPQETKEKTRHYNEKARNYLKEKLPEERRKQAVYRLKKMIVEIQGHEDCEYTSVNWILGPLLTMFQISVPLILCSASLRSTLATPRTSPSRVLER